MSEQLREEFNRWALDGRGSALESHHLTFVEDMMEEMQVRPADRILELGCGEGWAGRLLARRTPEGLVVGLDVSDEMIHNARIKSAEYENLMLLRGEAEEIPWQSSFFSKAICVESFFYFEDQEKALREIHRVMSPGGSVWILNHLSKENPLTLRWVADLKTPVHLLGADEYRALFEKCGFQGFSYHMVPDRTPYSADYGGKWFPDPSEFRQFRDTGALLMRARKSTGE